MFDSSDVILDCQTCVAVNTTACSDCVVNHVLANDDGPIVFVPVPLRRVESPVERAVGLLAKAGLLDAEPVEIEPAEFDAGVRDPHAAPVLR